jgi:hypothetical protein
MAIAESSTTPASPPEAEEWRPVVGTEGEFEVSNLGHVVSVAPAGVRTARNLNPSGSKGRYRLVAIRYPGRGWVNRLVHHLVLEAFVGPRPQDQECLHDDNDGSNNRLTNIKWGTKKENRADQHRHGTRPFREVRAIDGSDHLQCTKCGEWKPFDEFRRLAAAQSILKKNSWCKVCQNESDAARKRAKRAAAKAQ